MLTEHQSHNVAEVLWTAAQFSPGHACITELDHSDKRHALTYAQLRDRVAGLAGGLLAGGVKPGDRIALLLGNSLAYVEAFLGIAAAGAVVVPLNIRLREHDLRHMLTDSGSSLLITESDLLNAAAGLRAIDDLRIVLVDDESLDALHGQPIAEPLPQEAEDLFSLMYTSGTTGPPKAVMLPHRSWRVVADLSADVLRIQADDVILHTAPLTHGAGFLLLPTLAAGGANVVCRSYQPARIAQILHTEGVTGTFLVPSMIRMLLDDLPDDWTVPRTFRWIYYAGSSIDADTLREAMATFDGRLVQTFGQMESPMFLTVLDGDDHERGIREPSSSLIHSAGRALPGVDLAVIDSDGQPVPAGTNGEIIVRAPQTMIGYWRRPDASADALADGWLHTGDVGHVDQDGYLCVIDRLKDMIVTGGSNVYAREVEDALLTIPTVRDAAVVGLPDRLWGEAVTAILVPSGSDRDSERIIAKCRAQLADYRVPKLIYWIDELPRNASGKVLKRQLRDLCAAGDPAYDRGQADKGAG